MHFSTYSLPKDYARHHEFELVGEAHSGTVNVLQLLIQSKQF